MEGLDYFGWIGDRRHVQMRMSPLPPQFLKLRRQCCQHPHVQMTTIGSSASVVVRFLYECVIMLLTTLQLDAFRAVDQIVQRTEETAPNDTPTLVRYAMVHPKLFMQLQPLTMAGTYLGSYETH